MPNVDTWIWITILTLCLAVPATLSWSAHRALAGDGRAGRIAGRTAIGAAAWLALVVVMGAAGLFDPGENTPVPLIAVAVAAPIVAAVLLVQRSAVLHEIIDRTPQAVLLGAQTPRVIGGVFLVLLAQDKLPGHFAHPAGWGDIAVGLAAPLVALYYARQAPRARELATAFNVLGLVDLTVAIGTGFLSAPTPFRVLFAEPSTAIMGVLPMTLIPVFLVPVFVFVHLCSLRKLRRATPVATAGTTPSSTPAEN